MLDRLDAFQGQVEEVLTREGLLRAAPAVESARDRAFGNREEGQAFQAALERRLGPDTLARHAQGEEAVAAGLIKELGELGGWEADRLGWLVLAKAPRPKR